MPRRLGAAAPLLLAGFALALLGAASASAEESSDALDVSERASETSRPAPESPPAPDVGLDRLLELPSTLSFDQQTRNGASPEAWRSRFRASFASIREAENRVAQTRRELDELAVTGGGGQWQMAPPGANNTEVQPMSFKLREQLREGREKLEEAERKHRELIIQADLAGVPEDWRQPD